MNDPILDIASLDEFEFKNLIINIFYFLDNDIDIIQNENNIYDFNLEKENLSIILKINYNSNKEYISLSEVLDFKKEVIKTKSWKGYFFTNNDFDSSVYDNIEDIKENIRLFNHSEALRLGLRSI